MSAVWAARYLQGWEKNRLSPRFAFKFMLLANALHMSMEGRVFQTPIDK